MVNPADMTLNHRKGILLQLGVQEAQIPLLEAYLQFLWAKNEELNLFSRKMTIEELIDNHFVDCLLPLPYFPKDVKQVADFGSGGGLPALIYAILFPQIQFTLFEKSPKKQSALQECHVFANNFEVMGFIPSDLQRFDLITARAFKPINVIIQMSSEYFNAGGSYFLLKGRREKILEELKASGTTTEARAQLLALHSPLLEVERHLVRI